MSKRTDHDTVPGPEESEPDATRAGRPGVSSGPQTPTPVGDRPTCGATQSTVDASGEPGARRWWQPRVRVGRDVQRWSVGLWRADLERIRAAVRVWRDPDYLLGLYEELWWLQAEREWLREFWFLRRRAHADLLAAAKAALAARAEDEPGAWAYLADEVSHQTGRDYGGFSDGVFGDESGWRRW